MRFFAGCSEGSDEENCRPRMRRARPNAEIIASFPLFHLFHMPILMYLSLIMHTYNMSDRGYGGGPSRGDQALGLFLPIG